MNIVILLAALVFLIACIWSIIQKAWPMAFLSAGAFLIALDASSLIAS